MAFLVCFSQSPPHDHTHRKAIYLDQEFYSLIFTHCQSLGGPYVILREIALLRYKNPTLVIEQVRLAALEQELVALGAAGQSHSQIAEFRRVCSEARASHSALTIRGDMYPEL